MHTEPTRPAKSAERRATASLRTAAASASSPSSPLGQAFDLSALFVLLDGLRRAAPGELEGQMTKLIREFLLTLRSLIDWYLERLDRPRLEPEVEDIPIE